LHYFGCILRRFLLLGLLSPCAEEIKTASAPNSGRGQNSTIAWVCCPRFPLRLALSLFGGDKGRSLSKIPNQHARCERKNFRLPLLHTSIDRGNIRNVGPALPEGDFLSPISARINSGVCRRPFFPPTRPSPAT
jgi:hypothetical protein